MLPPFALSLPRANNSYPGGWTLGDYNVVSYNITDPFGVTWLAHGQMFVPLGYDPTVPSPFLMAGHGSGQASGTATGTPPVSQNNADNTSQLGFSTFAAAWLTANKSSCDHLVLFPQMQNIDLGNNYALGYITLRSKNTYRAEHYNSALQYALSTFNIDRSRMKLTGFSQGGFMPWWMATRYPTWWKYIAPVEGDCDNGCYPYDDTQTNAQRRQALSTVLAGASPIAVVYQNGDDGTVAPSVGREIASVVCGAPFTTPYTTAPSYSPNPYSVSGTAVLPNGGTYKEYSSGAHDPSNAWGSANVLAMLAV